MNCGAKLDVSDDMERFACAHCGTEVVVQRRGGTISLMRVMHAIERVQVGTEKTAAELAIARYEKELEIARSRESELSSALYSRTGRSALLGGLALLLGVAALFTSIPVGLLLILVGLCSLVYA